MLTDTTVWIGWTQIFMSRQNVKKKKRILQDFFKAISITIVRTDAAGSFVA